MKIKLPSKAARTPEREILMNRLVMGGFFGLLSYFSQVDIGISIAFLVYLSFNGALFVMLRHNIWKQEERWFSAIVLDFMMGFAVMLREPEFASVFYPLFLWVVLGNGFRYGIKWLFIASAAAVLSFGTIVATTSFWHHNQVLGYSLTLALIAIPAYCSTLIRKISAAKEQAEIASRAKSYFLASVSHELRTPLNAIIGYGNHLRQMDMPRNQREMIDASVLAGEHLLHLIEQLIQVSRSGAGSVAIKKSAFRPTELLNEIRHIMVGRVEEKGLTLQLQAEPLTDTLIEGPNEVVRNILLNLVGNAIKFTQAGSISVRSGMDQRGPSPILWFTVTDTGIGIAGDAVERIFEPFTQADDSVMNRFGGTGLGLSICKQLVEQVGGKISVESEVGQGSTFRFTIPVALANVDEAGVETEIDPETVNILSLGRFETELLEKAQAAGNFTIRHVECASVDELVDALARVELGEFKVAMISQDLAGQIAPDHKLWAIFSEAQVAPVLVEGKGSVDLQDVTLRAAFASVIPASPDFDALRSAIRIGCSLSQQIKLRDEVVPQPQAKVTPRRVLVADDNRTNRNVLAAILGAAGHEVTMATDGDEALDLLEAGGIDILLLDVNMPRLNGIDACRMWRQIEGGRSHLPIIGVTADATAETEQRCSNAGMDMRITKPVNSAFLLNAIENLCGGESNLAAAANEPDHDPLNVVVSIANPAKSEQKAAIDLQQIDYLWSIGDAQFVAGMIDGFFEDVAETIGPMRSAVANQDVQQFRFCAHAFKSAANNMGASQLAALCARLEKVTEGEFAAHALPYLDKVERELERAESELRSPDMLKPPSRAAKAG